MEGNKNDDTKNELYRAFLVNKKTEKSLAMRAGSSTSKCVAFLHLDDESTFSP